MLPPSPTSEPLWRSLPGGLTTELGLRGAGTLLVVAGIAIGIVVGVAVAVVTIAVSWLYLWLRYYAFG